MSEFLNALAAVAAALTLVGGAYAVGRSAGYRQARLDLNNEREAKRFSEAYAPIMGFFTTCHITTVSTQGAPHLRRRMRNAFNLAKELRLGAALVALFDKQNFGVSGEVEFGSAFPLHKITVHLQGREHFVDERLIGLVAQANRAQYEDQPQGNELTAADLALYEHICKQHEFLARRFIGA
jgi:hypothetical protein